MQDVIAALSPCVMTQKKEENKENNHTAPINMNNIFRNTTLQYSMHLQFKFDIFEKKIKESK